MGTVCGKDMMVRALEISLGTTVPPQSLCTFGLLPPNSFFSDKILAVEISELRECCSLQWVHRQKRKAFACCFAAAVSSAGVRGKTGPPDSPCCR